MTFDQQYPHGRRPVVRRVNPQQQPGMQYGAHSGGQYGIQPNMGSPYPQQRPQGMVSQRERDGGVGAAVGTAFLFVISIWSAFWINAIFFGGSLDNYGIRPRSVDGLLGILFAPLLHADLAHLIGNTVPAAIFTGLIAFSSQRLWWQVTTIVALVSGLATWVIAPFYTIHIGASGLIYGWLAFLVVRGFLNRSPGQIAIGMLLGFSYSGYIWGVFPTDAAVSWQMHLFGGVGGVLAAMKLRRGRR